MIHIDVTKRDDWTYVVQTSIDGSKWIDRYVHGRTVHEPEDKARHDAEWTARVYAAGARLAGAEVRTTLLGYPL